VIRQLGSREKRLWKKKVLLSLQSLRTLLREVVFTSTSGNLRKSSSPLASTRHHHMPVNRHHSPSQLTPGVMRLLRSTAADSYSHPYPQPRPPPSQSHPHSCQAATHCALHQPCEFGCYTNKSEWAVCLKRAAHGEHRTDETPKVGPAPRVVVGKDVAQRADWQTNRHQHERTGCCKNRSLFPVSLDNSGTNRELWIFFVTCLVIGWPSRFNPSCWPERQYWIS